MLQISKITTLNKPINGEPWNQSQLRINQPVLRNKRSQELLHRQSITIGQFKTKDKTDPNIT